jgi:hypothetical protein
MTDFHYQEPEGFEPSAADRRWLNEIEYGDAVTIPTTTATPVRGGGGGEGSPDGDCEPPPGGGGRGSGGAHLTLIADEPDHIPELDDDDRQVKNLELRLGRNDAVTLAEMWDIGTLPPRPAPTIGIISGTNNGLIYPGKSNALIAEAGTGKTTIAKGFMIEVASRGGNCVLVDREKDWLDFAHTMRTLRCPSSVASHIGYLRPTKALREIKSFVQLVRDLGVELVVLDSLSRDMSAAGLHENDNHDVRVWYDNTIEPLLEAGTTVLWIDHVGKPSEVGGKPQASEGRGARGGSAKLDAVTGANLKLVTAKPFSRNQAGFARIVATKDNSGFHTTGSVVAEVHVTPEEDDSMTVELLPPTFDAAGVQPWLRDVMERVSLYLEGVSQPVTKSRIQEDVSGNERRIGQAADRLVDGGYASMEPGDRNSQNFRSVQAFRQTMPLVAESVAAEPAPDPDLDWVNDMNTGGLF